VAEQEIIDVRVSRRILRVGGEVYQLRTITRAAAVRVTPNRRRTAGRCAGYLLIAAIVLLFVDFALFTSGVSAERESRVALVTVFAVLLLVSLARLISVLVKRTYYALVIETAGHPFTVLVSRDPQEVGRLVHQIMDALDDPAAEFHVRVENFHLGDKINMFGGGHNIGKVGR
jgi:hypothetical protein